MGFNSGFKGLNTSGKPGLIFGENPMSMLVVQRLS